MFEQHEALSMSSISRGEQSFDSDCLCMSPLHCQVLPGLGDRLHSPTKHPKFKITTSHIPRAQLFQCLAAFCGILLLPAHEFSTAGGISPTSAQWTQKKTHKLLKFSSAGGELARDSALAKQSWRFLFKPHSPSLAPFLHGVWKQSVAPAGFSPALSPSPTETGL